MSTITARDDTLTGTEREKSFFTRLGTRLMEARKRQADRAVAAYLLSLDDETLQRLGYDRRELERRDPTGYPFL
jgi:predicted signal transduction protein with EAL and GGDEF domain